MKRLLLILFALTSIVHGYFEINDGIVTVYSADGSRSWSMRPSDDSTVNIDWIFPPDFGGAGQSIVTDGATNVLSWGDNITVTGHVILGVNHTDTTTDAVTRGSLIYGNASPAWDELVIGGAGTALQSDGTDAAWSTIDLGTDTVGNYVASVATTSPLGGGAGGSEGAVLTLTIADADDDGATKGAASFDNTDFNATSGNITIVDDGHAHTGSSLSSVDISDDTNLAVTAPVTLTDDTVGITIAKDIVAGVGLSGGEDNVLPGADADITLTFDATELNALSWSDGSNASNIWTFNVSGTDHTMTAGNGLMTFSVDLTAVGTITGGTLTDGTATLTGGNLTVIGTIGADGDADLLSLAAGVLTVNGNILLPKTTSSVGRIIQTDPTFDAAVFHTFTPSQQVAVSRNVFVGWLSGNNISNMTNAANAIHATGNVGVGATTLDALTIGFFNFAGGTNSLSDITTGNNNVGIGHQTGQNIREGSDNLIFGRTSGNAIIDSSGNTVMGSFALFSTDGDDNTVMGRKAMFLAGVAIDRCIAIGAHAGEDEDASDRLIIDNRDRTSAALTRDKAIIYGVMDAAPENQLLTINAALTVDNTGGTDATFKMDGSSNNALTFTYESDNGLLIIDKATNIGGDTNITGTLDISGITRADGGVGVGIDPTAIERINVLGNTNGILSLRIKNESSGTSALARTILLNNSNNSLRMAMHSSGTGTTRFGGSLSLQNMAEIRAGGGDLVISTLTAGKNIYFGAGDTSAMTIDGATANVTIEMDLLVRGNLTVNGDIVTVNSIQVNADATVQGDLVVRGSVFLGNNPADDSVMINNDYFLPLIKGTAGYLVKQIGIDQWGYIDPGTLDVATADAVAVVDAGDTNATYFLGLWDSVSGDLEGKTDGGLTYNPSTNLLTVAGPITLKNGNELRFSDVGDSHYVGFEAPALTASQIWVLPDADGNANAVLTTDGAGNLDWTDPGLVFGEIYADDNAVTTDLAAQDTWYDVTVFTANGESNGTTPDHTDDSITIDSAGVYLVIISFDARSAQANDYYFSAFKNKIAGTELHNIEKRRTTTTANRPGAISISGFVNLAATDTISLGIRRSDGGGTSKSILIEHVNMLVIKMEGVLSGGGGGGGPKVIEAHTGDDTLTNAETGSVHTNRGAGGLVILTLPDPAIEGTEFAFCVQESQEIRIDPGTATIRFLGNPSLTAGKYIWADYIGETHTLIADSNGDWMTIAEDGIWTREI